MYSTFGIPNWIAPTDFLDRVFSIYWIWTMPGRHGYSHLRCWARHATHATRFRDLDHLLVHLFFVCVAIWGHDCVYSTISSCFFFLSSPYNFVSFWSSLNSVCLCVIWKYIYSYSNWSPPGNGISYSSVGSIACANMIKWSKKKNYAETKLCICARRSVAAAAR